jgi:hypothetical protein
VETHLLVVKVEVIHMLEISIPLNINFTIEENFTIPNLCEEIHDLGI